VKTEPEKKMNSNVAGRLIKRFRKDPVFFCQKALGITPWEKQRQVLESVRDFPRVAVRSGHGTGKSFIAASTVLWFLYSFYPSKVITTAPTWNQVRNILWNEIKKQHAFAALNLGGKVLEEKIKLGPDAFAVGLSTDEPERFQGYHAENILVILDEAPGVRDEIWEAAATLLTSKGARMLVIGNPTKASGAFYNCFSPSSSWQKIHISCMDSPNLDGNSKEYASLVTGDWIESKKLDWSEGSPLFKSRILGEFPDDGDGVLIPKGIFSSLPEVPAGGEGLLRLGVDVARNGEDSTVLVVRDNVAIREIKEINGADTMEVCGATVNMIKRNSVRAENVFIDDTGIGAGVTDRLKELGYNVNGVVLGSRADDTEHFFNLRAEIYWRLRESLMSGDFYIGNDKDLIAELSETCYDLGSTGAIKLEKKSKLKSRLRRSPDRADALALTFAKGEESFAPELTII
jgi:hypothetical protein